MLDTVGPELQVVNKCESSISLQADSLVVLTPDQDKEATANQLPLNFGGLGKVSSITICNIYKIIKYDIFLGFLYSVYYIFVVHACFKCLIVNPFIGYGVLWKLIHG